MVLGDLYLVDNKVIEYCQLPRQFLFKKEDVGESKSLTLAKRIKEWMPHSNVSAAHDSLVDKKYEQSFFQEFAAVINAACSREERLHVNKMCMTADTPLIETGVAGYCGQVNVHKKGISACYACDKSIGSMRKDYPPCVIRNYPESSEHCIIWAKSLLCEIFCEQDIETFVTNPIRQGQTELAGTSSDVSEMTESLLCTREWIKLHNYDHRLLFEKLFKSDIEELLKMASKWENRTPPVPLDYEAICNEDHSSLKSKIDMHDNWTVSQAADSFKRMLYVLKTQLAAASQGFLPFDEKNRNMLEFITASANLRASCFGIGLTKIFEVETLVSNIVPSITSCHGIIAGLAVLQLMKILGENYNAVKMVTLSKHHELRRNLIRSERTHSPNSKCSTCSSIPAVTIKLNAKKITVRDLKEKVLIEKLKMINPDVHTHDKRGTIILSSDPDEMDDAIYEKTLQNFELSACMCDDFSQPYKFVLNIIHSEELKVEFEFLTDVEDFLQTMGLLSDSVERNIPVASGSGFCN